MRVLLALLLGSVALVEAQACADIRNSEKCQRKIARHGWAKCNRRRFQSRCQKTCNACGAQQPDRNIPMPGIANACGCTVYRGVSASSTRACVKHEWVNGAAGVICMPFGQSHGGCPSDMGACPYPPPSPPPPSPPPSPPPPSPPSPPPSPPPTPPPPSAPPSPPPAPPGGSYSNYAFSGEITFAGDVTSFSTSDKNDMRTVLQNRLNPIRLEIQWVAGSAILKFTCVYGTEAPGVSARTTPMQTYTDATNSHLQSWFAATRSNSVTVRPTSVLASPLPVSHSCSC